LKEQQISIVAIEHVRSISTSGLKYELNNEQFPPACNGISNEAENDEFSINTSHPVWLFINHIDEIILHYLDWLAIGGYVLLLLWLGFINHQQKKMTKTSS
jgi:hypothetical protein